MHRTPWLIAGLATAIMASSAASAEAQLSAKGPALLSPRLNLKPIDAPPLRFDGAPTPLPRGVARTSVERREGGVTSAAGVLCGIQPSADDSGVGTARGYDKEGRFVGAKLAFSF